MSVKMVRIVSTSICRKMKQVDKSFEELKNVKKILFKKASPS